MDAGTPDQDGAGASVGSGTGTGTVTGTGTGTGRVDPGGMADDASVAPPGGGPVVGQVADRAGVDGSARDLFTHHTAGDATDEKVTAGQPTPRPFTHHTAGDATGEKVTAGQPTPRPFTHHTAGDGAHEKIPVGRRDRGLPSVGAGGAARTGDGDPGARFLAALGTVGRGDQPAPLPGRFRPLARALTGGATVRLVTGSATRRALDVVGSAAATVGRTIYLAEAPTGTRRHREIMAHELVHAARPSAVPRFFADPRPSAEERLAHDTGRRAAAGLPLAAARLGARPDSAAASGTVRPTAVAPRAAASAPGTPFVRAHPGAAPAETTLTPSRRAASAAGRAPIGGPTGPGAALHLDHAGTVSSLRSVGPGLRRAAAALGPARTGSPSPSMLSGVVDATGAFASPGAGPRRTGAPLSPGPTLPGVALTATPAGAAPARRSTTTDRLPSSTGTQGAAPARRSTTTDRLPSSTGTPGAAAGESSSGIGPAGAGLPRAVSPLGPTAGASSGGFGADGGSRAGASLGAGPAGGAAVVVGAASQAGGLLRSAALGAAGSPDRGRLAGGSAPFGQPEGWPASGTWAGIVEPMARNSRPARELRRETSGFRGFRDAEPGGGAMPTPRRDRPGTAGLPVGGLSNIVGPPATAEASSGDSATARRHTVQREQTRRPGGDPTPGALNLAGGGRPPAPQPAVTASAQPADQTGGGATPPGPAGGGGGGGGNGGSGGPAAQPAAEPAAPPPPTTSAFDDIDRLVELLEERLLAELERRGARFRGGPF